MSDDGEKAVDGAGTPQTAVWYFVAASLLFAVPTAIFPETNPFLRIAIIAAGFVLIILGGLRLGREMSEGRDRRDSAPDDETPL